MKTIPIILLVLLLINQADAQNITFASRATLQVYVQKTDGQQVILTSNDMTNLYDQLHMTGELDLRTLKTDNLEIQAIVDSLSATVIHWSSDIPEGQFVFQNTLNYTFTSEVLLNVGEHQSRFIMNFDISNRKNDDVNTFAVTCSGTLSLSEDLGVVGSTRLDDRVSFQFFQTIQTRNY